MSEFPLNDTGSRIVNGELVLNSPDSDWRLAQLADSIQSYLDEKSLNGSQAVLISFRYTGSSKFRFQASIQPENNSDYLYEIGIMFDEFPSDLFRRRMTTPNRRKCLAGCR